MKILLLDDNLMSAMRVEKAIAATGNEVTVANNPDKVEGDWDILLWNFGGPKWTPEAIENAVTSAGTRFPEAKLAAFCGHREVARWKAAQAAGVKMFSNDQMLGETLSSIQSLTTAF